MTQPTKRANAGRLGIVGYINILAAIYREPLTVAGIRERVGVGRTAIGYFIAGARHLRLVHIAGWQQEYNRPTLPMYAFGAGQDAPPPALRPTGKPIAGVRVSTICRPKPEVISCAAFLRAIADGATKVELAEHCGMSHCTVRLAIRALQRHRMVHVSAWIPTPGARTYTAVWQLGEGRSAARPAPQPKTVIAKRWRDAQRAKADMLQVLHAVAGRSANDTMREAA